MVSPAPERQLEVCNITTLAEFEECVRLMHVVWGEELAVPSGLFVVARHTGGQAIAAFTGLDRKMIGFVLALAARKGQTPYLHSHMAAVLPEYQNSGIGRSLKLFQREDALQQDISLIQWTFDPLEIKNAHFNLMRLGAIVREFIPNCYGITGSPLHSGLPTDRLVAEWHLDSERVDSIVADRPVPLSRVAGLITLPRNIVQMKATNPGAAAEAQAAARERFQKAFAEGLVATAIESHGAEIAYVLEESSAVPGLRVC